MKAIMLILISVLLWALIYFALRWAVFAYTDYPALQHKCQTIGAHLQLVRQGTEYVGHCIK